MEERQRCGDKDNLFLKSILFTRTAGGGGAEGTEGQNSKSGAVLEQGHPESLPPVTAWCSSSLAASEQRF